MDEESVKILKIWKDKTKNGDKEILKKQVIKNIKKEKYFYKKVCNILILILYSINQLIKNIFLFKEGNFHDQKKNT